MCKPKPQLMPFVWKHTDYVVFRFDYYSIGAVKDEIAIRMQRQYPEAEFTMHKLSKEDALVVDIDNMAHNLRLTLDEVNSETVYHGKYEDASKKCAYEFYVGRYFSQVIYRNQPGIDLEQVDFEKLQFLLDYFVKEINLNLIKMTCMAHTIVDETFDDFKRLVDEVVYSELREDNVIQTQYSDFREEGEMQTESKRVIYRRIDGTIKMIIKGIAYYKKLSTQNFLNSYVPLMHIALLENTRYFAQ